MSIPVFGHQCSHLKYFVLSSLKENIYLQVYGHIEARREHGISVSLTDWQDNQLTILVALPISWSLSLATVLISNVKTSQSSHHLPAVLSTVVFRLMAIILSFTYLNVWTFVIVAAMVVVNGCYQLLERRHVTNSETMLRSLTGLVSPVCNCQKRAGTLNRAPVITQFLLWTLPLAIVAMIVHDVLFINYEQKSLLNHSKANLALLAAGVSGFVSAGMTYQSTVPVTKEQQMARRHDVIFMWVVLVMGTLLVVFACRFFATDPKWLYLTFYPEANHTVSIKVCQKNRFIQFTIKARLELVRCAGANLRVVFILCRKVCTSICAHIFELRRVHRVFVVETLLESPDCSD